MVDLNIPEIRLRSQQLTIQNFKTPKQIVSWFGAIQSQDFAAAKWAISLRSQGHLTEKEIEKDFNDGKILRTHIMRPTWHFVTPEDIRWLIALTAQRVQAFNGHYYRKSGLSREIFQKSNEIIRKALQGGKSLTRDELNTELKKGKIPTENIGLSFTMMQAELEGIIVSGPRRGKQFTYMLLEERAPKTNEISRDEALRILVSKFFQSHAPAQIQDFTWWSGLSTKDARRGIELAGNKLNKETINNKTYFFYDTPADKFNQDSNAFLVPGFDEYFIAYKDRRDILDPKYAKRLNLGGGMLNGAVVVKGKMVGGWKRRFEKNHVIIAISLFEKITPSQIDSLQIKAQRYGKFIELPVVLNTSYNHSS